MFWKKYPQEFTTLLPACLALKSPSATNRRPKEWKMDLIVVDTKERMGVEHTADKVMGAERKGREIAIT